MGQPLSSTITLLKRARDEKIIIGPKIWCNTGFEVELEFNLEDPFLKLEKKKKTRKFSYLTALVGSLSLICFKKGASILEYAEAITPTFPAKKKIDEIVLEEKGELPRDEYPRKWDEKDWRVFETMRNPNFSFVKAGEKLGMSWHTVKNRFEKLLEDCKIWMLFFPKGYHSYQQSFLLFNTRYEIGLRNELEKLDRSSVLYKFGCCPSV